METKWSLDSSSVSAELKRFIAEKCAQVRAEVRAPEHPMSPESQTLFAAAERGDWRAVLGVLEEIRACMRKGENKKGSAVYPVEWAAWLEIGATLHEFATGGEKFAISFARDIINSIPPGSIYFGGTDWGRFLVTALSRSHAQGDPFFTITQNALVDRRSYLRYVRGMYGNRIYVPSDEDATNAMREYEEDARRRQKEGKLMPGERFEEVNGKVEFSGQLTVMAINAALTKLIFEKNQDRDFYIEESFPLEWMYPHLSPHGLIMKINRQPLAGFSQEVLEQDRHYWTRYLVPMIGGWLKCETSLQEVVNSVEKLFSRGEFQAFSADVDYLRHETAQRSFAKLRSSIAGLYVWRAQRAQRTEERERMVREADFGFLQAFALCPAGPEAVFRYVSLLLQEKRLKEAILLTEAAVKHEDAARAAAAARGQEDLWPKAMLASQANPGKFVTQMGHLLEQLKRFPASGTSSSTKIA